MADVYYVEEGYVDVGYYTYQADAASAQQATSTMSVSGGIVKEAEVSITPAFTPSMLVNVLKNHTAVLDSTSTFNITANKTTDTGSLLEYFANLSAMADVTRDVSSTLDSTALISIDFSSTQYANAELTSSFTQTVTPEIIRDVVASLTATTSQQATISPIREGIVLQASLGTLAVSADRTREDTFTFDAIATSLITGEFVPQEASAVLDSTATLNAVFEKIVQGSSTQSSTATTSISGNRIRFGQFTLVFAFSPNMVAGELQPGTINLNAASSVVAVGKRIRFVDSTASSFFTSTTNPIEYQAKTYPFNRPFKWVRNVSPFDDLLVTDTTSKTGTYSGWIGQPSLIYKTNNTLPNSIPALSPFQAAIWFKPVGTLTSKTIFQIGGTSLGDTSAGIRFYSSGGLLKAAIKIGSTTYTLGKSTGSFQMNSGVWHYLSVTYNISLTPGFNQLSFYTESGSDSIYIDINTPINTSGYAWLGNPTSVTNNDCYFDDIQFTSNGYGTTYFEGTVFNFDFENGTPIDNTAVNLTGSAALTSTSTLSAKLNYQTKATVLQASLGTLTATIGAIYPRSASLSSAFTANITGMFKPQEAAANLSSTASMSVIGDKYKIIDATLSSSFTLSATGRADFSAATLEASLGTMTVVPFRIKQLSSTQTSLFTSNITGRFKPFEAVVPLQGTFSEYANPIEYRKRPAPAQYRPLQWEYWDQYGKQWSSLDFQGYTHIDTTDYINNDGFDGGHKLRIGPEYQPSTTPLAGSYGNINGTRWIRSTNGIADRFIGSNTDFCFRVDFKWGGNWSDGAVTYYPSVGVTIGHGSAPNYGGISIGNGGVVFYTGTTRRQIATGTTSNQWYRITVRRTNGLLTVSNYNTVLFTLNNNQDYINLCDGILDIYANDGYDNPPGPYVGVGIFDNISLQIGSSVYNFVDFDEVAEDLVYTTMFHLNFENPAALVDKTSIAFYGAAALTSTATMTIDMTRVKGTATLLASLGNLTAAGNVTREVSSTQSSTFTANITGMFKPQEAEATLSTTASLIATGESFKEVSCSMTAFASELAVNMRILKTGTNFIADTALEASPIVFYYNGVAMQAQATAVFANNITRTDSSIMASAFTTVADTGDSLAKVASASLTSAATLSVSGTCIRTESATLPVIASDLTATMRLAGLFVDDNTQATLSVSGRITSGTIVDFNTISTQSVLTGKIQQASAQLDAVFGKQFDATTNIIGISNQTVTATETVSPIVTFFGGADLHAFGNSTTSVKITRTDGVDLFSTATMSIAGDRIRLAAITINTNANLAINAGKIEQATINAQMTATLTAVGRFIQINDYVYIIPREYREFAIHSETRNFTIARETREYIIGD